MIVNFHNQVATVLKYLTMENICLEQMNSIH